ncbi:MAG TPA: extracellular solute-binding protein [Nocardioidaceae bacterium]|nr:extracellular solute-binding protein [Nocardioidaceae bacterium]
MARRRGTRTLVGATLLCALVAGCTTADPERNSPDPSPSDPSTPTEAVTVSLGVYGPKALLDAYEDLAEQFSDENPSVTVDLRTHDEPESLLAEIEEGDSPDIFLMAQRHVPGLVEEERVQPVDGLLEARQVDFGDGYQRGGLTAFAADAALQCMPHDVSPVVVYYNKDLVDLARLGTEGDEVPSALDGWTWEMFAQAARQAARGPVHGVHIDPSLEALAPFIWSAGGELVDDVQAPTTLTLSSGESRDALEQVLALVRDPRVTPTLEALEERDAVERFVRGELAMILGSRALTPVLRAEDDLDFDVMPLPRISRLRTIADMNGYCISSDTEHVETAADLLAFAVSSEGAAITARTGHVVPSNLDVAHSSDFDDATQEPESSFIFNEGVRRAQSLPFVGTWPEVSASVEPDLVEMFYAPVIELDTLLERIDTRSGEVLAPESESDAETESE